MKKVYIADTIPQAHLVAIILNEEGIQTRIDNGNLVSAYGEIPPATDTFPSVYVLEDSSYEEAMKILESKVKGFKATNEYRSIVEVAAFGKFWILLVLALVIVVVVLVMSSAFG